MDDFCMILIILICLIIFMLYSRKNTKKVRFNLSETFIPVNPHVLKTQKIPYQDRFLEFSLNKNIENRKKFEHDLNDVYYNYNNGDISNLYDKITSIPLSS